MLTAIAQQHVGPLRLLLTSVYANCCADENTLTRLAVNRDSIKELIDLEGGSFLQRLIEAECISEQEKRRIEEIAEQSIMTGTLLDIIKSKRKDVVEKFVDLLQEVNNRDVLKALLTKPAGKFINLNLLTFFCLCLLIKTWI